MNAPATTEDRSMRTDRDGRGGEWRSWGPVFVVLALLCLLVGIYLLDHAAPREPNLFDKRWDADVRRSWDEGLARVGAMLVAAAAASSAVGLLLRVLLGHGRGDHATRALLVLGLVGALVAAWAWTSVPLG